MAGLGNNSKLNPKTSQITENYPTNQCCSHLDPNSFLFSANTVKIQGFRVKCWKVFFFPSIRRSFKPAWNNKQGDFSSKFRQKTQPSTDLYSHQSDFYQVLKHSRAAFDHFDRFLKNWLKIFQANSPRFIIF